MGRNLVSSFYRSLVWPGRSLFQTLLFPFSGYRLPSESRRHIRLPCTKDIDLVMTDMPFACSNREERGRRQESCSFCLSQNGACDENQRGLFFRGLENIGDSKSKANWITEPFQLVLRDGKQLKFCSPPTASTSPSLWGFQLTAYT